MHIATVVARVTALRKEKRGIANLLAAVNAEAQRCRIYGGDLTSTPLRISEVNSPSFGLEIPAIHPYSEIWNLVELDPNRWH